MDFIHVGSMTFCFPTRLKKLKFWND